VIRGVLVESQNGTSSFITLTHLSSFLQKTMKLADTS
jgi:hypothetical protein